ncbi:MAG: hypothetical protein H0W88_04705 [Parachlamydiaceae bacterium]|nr:hypothetical protein [Parachlamydiaceae bacterium]
MNAIQINKNKIILEVTKDELGVLSNALNEVCNGIEIWEFDTRMGIKIEEARDMLKKLNSFYVKSEED